MKWECVLPIGTYGLITEFKRHLVRSAIFSKGRG